MNRILFIAILLCALRAGAQTNISQGHIEFELAPTFSTANLTDLRTGTWGWSFQSSYWQNKYTGTFAEIGNYNAKSIAYGEIDHIAIGQSVRVAPFTVPFFNRIELQGNLAAETFFQDGSKDIELGPQVNFRIDSHWSAEVDYSQHFRTVPKEDGGTLRAGINLRF